MNLIEVLKKLNRRTKIVGECWLAETFKDKDGYTFVYFENQKIRTHRFSAFVFLNFDLNSELQINHKRICLNKNCWNPDHIYIGNQSQNRVDAIITSKVKPPIQKKRKFCKKGHELTENNLIIHGEDRRCKSCKQNYRKMKYQESLG